jgi:hypothetical protein
MAEGARFVKNVGYFLRVLSFVFHFHLKVYFHILTPSDYRRKAGGTLLTTD